MEPKSVSRWWCVVLCIALLASSMSAKAAVSNETYFSSFLPPRPGASRSAAASDARLRFLQLRDFGGEVAVTARPNYGCRTKAALARHMAFIMYGSGKPEPRDNCWVLASGTSVALIECMPGYEICRFQPRRLGIPMGYKFWTSAWGIDPHAR